MSDIDRFNSISTASDLCIKSITDGTYAVKYSSVRKNTVDAIASVHAFETLFSEVPTDFAVFFFDPFNPKAKFDQHDIQKYIEISRIAIYYVDSVDLDHLVLKYAIHTFPSSLPISVDPLLVPINSFGTHTFLSVIGVECFDVQNLISPPAIKLSRSVSTSIPPSPAATTSSTIMPPGTAFPVDSTALFEFMNQQQKTTTDMIKASQEQIRLEREDALKRHSTPAQQDSQKKLLSVTHLFDTPDQKNSVAHIFDPAKGTYLTEFNLIHAADMLQTLLGDTSHHYYLNLSKPQQLQLLFMEFSPTQLTLSHFLPNNDSKSSTISNLEQLQFAFSALAYTTELIFGCKLSTSLRTFHIAAIELIHCKNLSVEQLLPFISTRLQQLKSLPTSADGSFPYAAIEDLISIDTSQPSVQQFLDKATAKSLASMKSQIDSLTSKLSSLSKFPKDSANVDKPGNLKHTPNFATKPKWSNPSTDKDPCFYFTANKGSCAGKTDCTHRIPRPHSWPASATTAQKEAFTKWVLSKDSPVYNK